ncbi:putative sulfate exporter family transporter [Helicobacter sp. 13S00401-1]|uniref:YeiH family protein n=1 Tax=Helicobacter sp. 13S00401-1 TaxID=1905758 RepID=UPI000BA5A2F1|nr:putative sulfate exporter family transporter [Helicobacter sp. 13S00401-1]
MHFIVQFKNKLISILPGLIISIIIAAISLYLARFVPKLGAATVAIFLGLILGNLFLGKKVFQSGYKYSESSLLTYSIILLGATISVSTIAQIGVSGVAFIIIQMIVTILAVLYIGKKLGFNRSFSFMMAGGNAVCGSSAITAISPVVNANDKDRSMSIAIVNVTGIVLMFVLPGIGKILYDYETLHTSALLGGVLQSIGQVVAGGAMVNDGVKDLATIFKIVRIIFLVVVVLAFGYFYHKSSKEVISEEEGALKAKKIVVPWYVIGFFVMFGLFSFHLISPSVSHVFKVISGYLEVIALAAIGLRINIRELIKQGKKLTIYALCVGIVQIVCALILLSFIFKL